MSFVKQAKWLWDQNIEKSVVCEDIVLFFYDMPYKVSALNILHK